MTSLFSFPSIRGRLNALGFLVISGLLFAGAIGILATEATQSALKRAYQDRLVPLRILKVLSESYSSKIPGAIARMNNGEYTTQEGYLTIAAARDSIQRCWRLYQAIPLSPEERDVLMELQGDLGAADQEIEGFMHMLEIFQEQGRGLLSNQLGMILNSLDPAVRPLTEKIDNLTRIQLDLAQQEYQTSEKRFVATVALLLLLITLILLVLFLAGFKLQKHIMTQLRHTLPALQQIGKGDLRVHIDTQAHDEFADIGQGINQMAHSLRVLVGRIAHSSAHLQQSSAEFARLSESIAKSSRTNATHSNLTSIATSDASGSLAEIARNLAGIGNSVEQLVTEMEQVRQSVSYAKRVCEDETRLASNAIQESQGMERILQQAFRNASDLAAILAFYLQGSPGKEILRDRMEECVGSMNESLQGIRRLVALQGNMTENSGKVMHAISDLHHIFDHSYQLLQTLHISTHGASRDMAESSKALIRIAKTADLSRESAMESAKEIALIRGKSTELKSLSEDLGQLSRRFHTVD